VLIYKELRPPVASVDGESPLRNRSSKKLFSLANGAYDDRLGFRISKEQLVACMGDDGRLVDPRWNGRHHVTNSQFNVKNHRFYKVSRFHLRFSDIFRQEEGKQRASCNPA
jgi:hypothetical protein